MFVPLKSLAMNTKQPITYIDATGLLCPHPLMLLKQAVEKVSAGDAVTIVVTDEHAELDFEIWCEKFGHQLTQVNTQPGLMTFKVTKAVK